MTIDTACSASLVAVDVACRYLDSFQANAVLVGGANLWLTPEHNEEIGMMHMTQSASGKCHSFDAKADGYVKAEGINVVYLKRLDDALRDGDPIRAVIRGTSAGASGRTPGIANPSSDAQAYAIRMAYQSAGISDFQATGYLECHGTGTLAGDPVEVRGAASVFGAGREDGKELVIGSIKSNIGHSEAAAGLSGLIKAVMAVETGTIPGNPTFVTPNPNIDWKSSRVRASRTSLKWPSNTAVRRASVNSFGFGGANAHAVLEYLPVSRHVSSYKKVTTDFFDDDEDDDDEDISNAARTADPKILAFSANDQASLKNYVKALNAHLLNPMVSIDLNDLAYTLSERRTRHYYRGFAITRSSKAKVSEETLVLGKQASSLPRIGFVFTGQGAQWSQMGLELVKAFPQAKRVLQDLDEVLQALPEPPKWSLLQELTDARSPETLRQPEFSQPLVTALQLALLQVLNDWGVHPQAVVGHSSGEIAAAAAAGLISPQDAIKTAYYRGTAAKKVGTPVEPVGMLAVGVGPDVIEKYIEPSEGRVQIACYNSPTSLTMSGTVAALEKLSLRLKKDDHFARMLLVDLAYHSDHMSEIGEVYEKLLLSSTRSSKTTIGGENNASQARMFSSVTGKPMPRGEAPGAEYWKANMVSPVRFTQAASELLRDAQDGADFLIEIGPSNALAGPIAQIKKSLGGSTADVPYTSALKRGADSVLALYNTAGQLFLSGGPIDLARVNRGTRSGDKVADPKVIVDLPNYAWNHSTRYWHESQASKDWRFKKFVNHDLLGSKMLGTSWEAPVFKKVLKLADVPWLRDHQLGRQVVFPGAAYVTMAIEAIYQVAMVTQWNEQPPARYRFRLRDVKFNRALVLEDNIETRYTLALSPIQGGSTRSWYEYRVSSQQEGLHTSHVHSSGLVCVETDYQEPSTSADVVKALELATPGHVWYKALADSGYNFGPCFQKHEMVEMDMGQRNSRSVVNLEAPPSAFAQSPYPMHPAVMDACLQTGTPPLWKGDPSAAVGVLVPKVIDSLVLSGTGELPPKGVTRSSATFLGVGDRENPRNYATNVSLYDPQGGALLFEMKGLSMAEIETSEEEGARHSFTSVAWEADVDMLLSAGKPGAEQWLAGENGLAKTCQDVINLVAHKTPGLSVLELNLNPEDASSLWMPETDTLDPMRQACSQYHLALREPKTLISAQNHFSSRVSGSQFHLLDVSQPGAIVADVKFDLLIVKQTVDSAQAGVETDLVIQKVAASVREGGFIIAVGFDETVLHHVGQTIALPSPGESACICQRSAEDHEQGNKTAQRPVIQLVSLLEEFPDLHETDRVLSAIGEREWTIQRCNDPLKEITSSEAVIVVIDELFSSVMDRLDERQWQILKHITQQRCRLLWVTSGAHLEVTDPTKAAMTGLMRTIRAEEQLQLITLDVEEPSGTATAAAISSCLECLCGRQPAAGTEAQDSEFVERRGVIRIPRLLPDATLTALQSDEISARKTDTMDLHGSDALIKLRCERLGKIDSIHFAEAQPEPLPLEDGCLEIEVYAAGLNYKDVVVTMGIVPGDETAMGHEAAGIVTRVTPGVAAAGFNFEVGQRVVVFGKASFANRVQTTPGRVHRIPDSMTFEEAATLSVVYLTSSHSLFDLANLTAGQRVLIHSAAGGVGIAAIQLAQYVGAEIFVTVGTAEKREFIKSTFGLSDTHIFNSRNTDFGSQIMSATNGAGVDVVLNSLTGDMLDESFRILADGGIMVEIGKKDILDRNHLPMAPFDRNISFRAVDLSPERAPDALVARLLRRIFALINGGHIQPIRPIHRFSWTDIPSAIRFLRAGKHIGKIVLSDGEHPDKIEVPVRRAPKMLRLRDNGSYLIVGGLRGLCGSLAIYLAKVGVKNIAVVSRSGHTDEKSRAVVKQVNALGAHIDLLTADVTNAADVERAFKETVVPVAGIIQGAMVLRDRPFDSMTITEYHEAVQCKIQGTWNLHNAAEKLGLELDFFTMLSSISGVVGNRGQANYAAANVFLDSFAAFRRRRGQAACSVNLGVIEDAGFIANNAGFQEQHFDGRVFKGINNVLLRKILELSILQQQQQEKQPQTHPLQTQIVTGIIVPQPSDSLLKPDARFSALFTGQSNGDSATGGSGSGNAEVQALLLLLRTASADPAAQVAAAVDVVGKCFMRLLRLSDPMDPARPFSVYGIDSLSAVEVRNWVRGELGALVTTLDIMNASSLTSFCEKIVSKIVAGDGKN
ncbi:hypothetical protein EYZ11_007940 [Aspergillus tanneri]|nr:hypothetical protein EYZ11_007940 [Aspergillus tanneri]